MIGADDEKSPAADVAAARVATAGGAVRLDLPLVPLDLPLDARGVSEVDSSAAEEDASAASSVVAARVRADIAGLDARLRPELAAALRRAIRSFSRRGSARHANARRGEARRGVPTSRIHRNVGSPVALAFETTCRFFDGARLAADSDSGSAARRKSLFATRAKTAELRVNVRDERVDRSVSIGDRSIDGLSMTGGPFPGRGVVVAAEEWRWVPGRMRKSENAFSSKDEFDENFGDCFRASRFEARRFGDARDVEITDARFDARVDALAELEAGFREALSALSAAAATTSSGKKKQTRETPRASRGSALPALSAVRRSRLAFVNARVRARVDSKDPEDPDDPEDPEDAREEAGGSLLEKEKDPGSTPECALEARAARLVWERTSETGDGPAETRSEERVDARGLVLTYVDAMDPTTPPCGGFADVETAGDRSRSGAGSSADEGTEKEKKKKKTSVKTSSRWRRRGQRRRASYLDRDFPETRRRRRRASLRPGR